jgi:plasmid maintenance system antidote protein VapI
MNKHISIIKGIHPGFILERELKKRKIAKGRFALSLGEYPQTLVSITKGKRNMNVPLSLKIEQALKIEEGYFMVLQAYYEIAREKKKHRVKHPDLSKIRKILFWDTSFDKIDWVKHKISIIKRVFQRGNEEEKKEIRKFYGSDTIDSVLNKNGK